jgi:hypothetical protein
LPTRSAACTVSGKTIAALKAQCDSAHSPMTAPAWMSSPPSRMSQALITVSKYE